MLQTAETLQCEQGDMTFCPLSNYGKWWEWLLLTAEVTALKSRGPSTQLGAQRHIHIFASTRTSLKGHRGTKQGEGGLLGDAPVKQDPAACVALCDPAEEGKNNCKINKNELLDKWDEIEIANGLANASGIKL